MSTTPDNKYGIDDALKLEEQEHPARAAMSRRTFAKVAGVSAAALAIGGTGALAWFTGRDAKVNKVSIANGLNVRVVEPAWVPENAMHVVARQHLPKDPRIENLSDEFAGWMVVEIRVPTAVVSVFDETEQKVLDPVRTPLFSFTADPRWTALEQFEDGDTDVYRFGWPQTIPALGQTPPIFEEVIVANLAEAQGQSGEKIITATAYGIQEEALPDIKTAWEAYKKQNGITDGEPGNDPDPEEHWQFWLGTETDKQIGPDEIVAQLDDLAANGDASEFADAWYGRMSSQEPLYIEWGDGTIRTATVIGINHDELAEGAGTAGATFMFEDLIGKNYTLDSVMAYTASPITQDLSEGGAVRALVPEQLENAVKTVAKFTVVTNTRPGLNPSTTKEKFWILSGRELFGDNTSSSFGSNAYDSRYSGVNKEGEQYEWFADWLGLYVESSTRLVVGPSGSTARLLKKTYGESSNSPWWLRSYAPSSGSQKLFVRDSVANIVFRSTTAATCGIAPCFCI